MRPFLFALPLFWVRIAFAQPPDAPSTIGAPATSAVRGAVARPDPPPITPEELQQLYGEPTRVTFSGRGVPLFEVVGALMAAGDVPRSSFRTPLLAPVNVTWNQLPFWDAAAELERATGRVWGAEPGDGLSLTPVGDNAGADLDGAVAAQTPYVKIVAHSLSRELSAATFFGAKPGKVTRRERLQLRFSAYFDPKLWVQTTSLRWPKYQIQTKDGVIDRPAVPYDSGVATRHGWNGIAALVLPFASSTPRGRVYSRLSGWLHAAIVTDSQLVEVFDLAANPKATQIQGKNRYDLDDVKIEAKQLSLSATALLGERVPPDQARNAYAYNIFRDLRVLDAQGRELPRLQSSNGTTNGAGQRIEGRFVFGLQNSEGEPIPGPYSLNWKIPTQTRSLHVPFELRDVVVP